MDRPVSELPMKVKQVEPLRKRAKKLRKKQLKLTTAENVYGPLGTEANSEATAPHTDEVILVDSENDDYGSDNDVVVISDEENEVVSMESNTATTSGSEDVSALSSATSNGNHTNPRKRRLSEADNEVAGNNDFISFGFSSSEDEADRIDGATEDTYSDDGYISDDQSGSIRAHSSSKTQFPWVKGQDHSRQKEIADWLTLEIKDFVNYISPSIDEISNRNTVINTLKQNISSFWPNAQAHVFGSCATDLYLPGSDIDMVVISTTGDYEQRSRLYQLSSFLRTNQLAKNIQVIASAKVPIIKFVDPRFNIHVDISFERSNGLDAARRIRKWLDMTPGLRELVLIIKQFLRSRHLNDVHVGGLGGYATIIMVYHFLKLHPRVSTNNLAAMENLGTLLIEFFELYGLNFSYDKLVIAINNSDDSPKYLPKSACPQLRAIKGQFSIIIQDPSDPLNNITRSSYNLRGLKKAFVGAFQLLVSKCYELHGASYKARIGALILGDIIKFRGKDRDFNDDRDKVVNHALIDQDYDTDSESDGANGNDKYYLSDMTDESDEDKTRLDTPKVVKNSHSPAKRTARAPLGVAKPESTSLPPKPAMTQTGARTDGKKVADFLSLDDGSEGETEPVLKRRKSLSSLDKGAKRDYWSLKGLEA